MAITGIEVIGVDIFKLDMQSLLKLIRQPPNQDASQQQSFLSKWLSKESGTIKFKIFSYTSQSTVSIISQAICDMVDRNIEIQLLRPNLQKPLKIWNAQNNDDKRYWKAVKSDAETLDKFWLMIPDATQRKVKVDICLHPFDPQFKAIFINDKHALLGFYVLEKHTKSVLPEVTSWDYIGYKVKMMELHNSDKGDTNYLFRWALNFFDTTWKNFSKPIIRC